MNQTGLNDSKPLILKDDVELSIFNESRAFLWMVETNRIKLGRIARIKNRISLIFFFGIVLL